MAEAEDLMAEPSMTVLRATSPDDAEKAVAEHFLANRLSVVDRGPLSMRLSAARLGMTTAGQLEYGRQVRLVTEEAHQIHVNTPLRGFIVSRTGRSAPLVTTSESAAVFPADAPADIEWSSGAAQVCLMIPRTTLETELEQLVGRSLTKPLRLPFHMSLTTPEGRAWRNMVNLLSEELANGCLMLRNPHAGRQMERTLVDALLLGQPHDHLEEVVRPSAPALPAAIRRAVDLLHEKPGEPWSSTSLARAVHVSLRSLQGGFHTHVGMPPMAYLRQLRLTGVRDQLRTASPTTTTVQAVAYSWGMLHMGRFASLYRDTFGELPSQTLKAPPS